MRNKPKLFRVSAASISLRYLLRGQLCFLNQYFKVKCIASPDAVLEEVGNIERVDTIGIPISRKIDFIKDLLSLWRLVRLFRKERPVIVHSLTPKAGLLSMVAAKLTGVPHRIHSFTGLIFPSRKGFMYYLLKNMDRITCFCATKVLPEGNGVKKDLIEHGVTGKQLNIIGYGNINGINIREFSKAHYKKNQLSQIRKKYQIQKQDFVFIFVGRLVEEKGINELISAFVAIPNKDNRLKLMLVGPREELLYPLNEKTLKVISSNTNIIETGWQDDVRPFLALADVFVFPSHREGFPNVVIQAGAMELPSIVSDINGCNEIIVEGENGIIVPFKDANTLSQTMRDLIENRVKRQRMGKKARPMIVERYNQRYVWTEMLKEYQALLK